MKKTINLIIGMLLIASFGFATNPVEVDNSLSVVADSGLKLRSAPTLNSTTIKVIPFGDLVYAIEDSISTEILEDRIEWMEGKWIKIEHMGDQGYVFDGFLTNLPVPQFDFELTYEDMDLRSPLESWMSYRFDVSEEPKIYEENEEVKMITNYEGGHRKIEFESPYMYKITLQLQDTEIHEMYNILKGMLMTGYEKSSFETNALFVENKYGDINKIKVNIEMPVEIKRLAGNQVQVSVTSYYGEDCRL